MLPVCRAAAVEAQASGWTPGGILVIARVARVAGAVHLVHMRELPVDVWSDIACPWCWVGKRRLEEAVARFERPVRARWHAFELDPSAAPAASEPVDYVARLARKYGTSRAQAQAMIDRMTAIGKDCGLDLRFDRVRPGNTFDAHRLSCWAGERERQDAVEEKLFTAYLHEGRSVSDASVLVRVAADAGLDAERAAALLASDDYADEVRTDEAMAARLGISGVPFFVFDGRYAVSGAQPSDLLLRVLERAAQDAATASEAAGDDDLACGPDSCAVED